MHMHILLYVIMTQLQSVVIAIPEYGMYETNGTFTLYYTGTMTNATKLRQIGTETRNFK